MKKIGRTVGEILPSARHPRNTEGSFVELKNGDILFAFSRFIGGSDDISDAEIAAVVSRDNGETFGEERCLIKKKESDDNIMSVSFLRMLDGALGIFYLRKFKSESGINCCIPCFSKSYDEGVTWSEPKRCIDDDDYYVLNNDRVIRLSTGRVLFAVAHHPRECDEGQVEFVVSDDDCESFRKIEQTLKLPFKHDFSGFQEPGVVELADGRIWAWTRTAHAYQFESYSEDGGESWSEMCPNEFFTSPNSPMSVKRLKNDDLVAIFNPIPMYNTRFPVEEEDDLDNLPYKKNLYHAFSVYGGRTPYVLAVGRDDSKGFCPRLMLLEDDPKYAYCYASMLEREDYLLVSYFTTAKQPIDEVSVATYGINIKKIPLSDLRF